MNSSFPLPKQPLRTFSRYIPRIFIFIPEKPGEAKPVKGSVPVRKEAKGFTGDTGSGLGWNLVGIGLDEVGPVMVKDGDGEGWIDST